MDTDQIDKDLIKIKIFEGTFARDCLPIKMKKPVALISNTDSQSEPGEHWVAILLLEGDRGEFFDPFGLPVLHQDFADYMDSACPKGWIWNNITLQDPDDSSCGSWCIQYIRARSIGLSLVEFLLLNSEHLIKNHL